MQVTEQPRRVIVAMAKVELNVHLAGTVPRAQAEALAVRNGARELLELPPAMLERPRSIDEFLQSFDAIARTLRTPSDLRRAIHDHLVRAAARGVVHTEVLWSPMLHLDDGLPYRAQVAGLRAGIADAAADGVATSCGLVATIDRERPVADAGALLDLVLGHRDDLVVGIALAYGERLPAAPFAPVFRRAAAAGLGLTAFAGETSGPRDVADCVQALGCSRVSHGHGALANRRVAALARERGTHFVLTPASTDRLRSWGQPAAPGVLAVARAGLEWSISTNNPARYRTDLCRELEAAHREGVSLQSLATSMHHAAEAAFLDGAERTALRHQLEHGRAAGATVVGKGGVG
jgi:adenosine deaminase